MNRLAAHCWNINQIIQYSADLLTFCLTSEYRFGQDISSLFVLDIFCHFPLSFILVYLGGPARLCGLTRSATVLGVHWGGDVFDSWPKLHHIMFKLYLLLLCQMPDINNISMGNAWAQNRRNPLQSTVRTLRQRSCNQIFYSILDLLNSLALGCNQTFLELWIILEDFIICDSSKTKTINTFNIDFLTTFKI